MPIHDWSRVYPCLFHDFVQTWTCRISNVLNKSLLPGAYFALLTKKPWQSGRSTEAQWYARKVNRIAVSQRLDEPLAVIEVVSPGNKDTVAAEKFFVEQLHHLHKSGAHVLLIDLFRLGEKRGKLTLFESGVETFTQSVDLDDSLPNMPLLINKDIHVNIPLEATYQDAWKSIPEVIRGIVETGVLPNPDADE